MLTLHNVPIPNSEGKFEVHTLFLEKPNKSGIKLFHMDVLRRARIKLFLHKKVPDACNSEVYLWKNGFRSGHPTD